MRAIVALSLLCSSLPAEDKFEVADGFVFEEVLREPHVAQPVSLSFDERGRMWVVEYRQYPYPAGLKVISKDRFWRTVFDKVPEPPPKGAKGKDRISIHEDTNGDGTFDKHTVFLDDLNIATACARGRGGVFVLNPPYLLFYADANNDDKPDGPPEVLLEGFGLQDTHSCVNSLTWGPDGWLYAAQGSTVTGNVRRYGSKDKPQFSMGQLVWRYHPERKKYEIFAEGGGNAYGIEIDSKGRVYSGHNGGNTRGFHYVQGGYYRKGFQKHGALSNPYSFGYFEPIKHAKVPRFTHDFAIYEADLFPKSKHGRLFGVEPLQGRVVETVLKPLGSTFESTDVGRIVVGKEKTFRPVVIELGPDGALYVADFREKLISHRDHYQGNITKNDGRIYRLKPKGSLPVALSDLSKKSSRELLLELSHPNRWRRMTALRLLGDRKDKTIVRLCAVFLRSARVGERRLDYLWALHLSGGLTARNAIYLLQHEDPDVRLWTIRLLCDNLDAYPNIADSIARLPAEKNVRVRSQLACSARRMPPKQGLWVLDRLIRNPQDVNDPHLPLLVWWAIERFVSDEPETVLTWLKSARGIWMAEMMKQTLLPRLARRFAATGKRIDFLRARQLFEIAPKTLHATLLKGIEDGIADQPGIPLPTELITAIRQAGGGSVTLRVRLGDEKAVSQALAIIADQRKKLSERVRMAELLREAGSPAVVSELLKLVHDKSPPRLTAAVLSALREHNANAIGKHVADALPRLQDHARDAAIELLASRPAWGKQLLAAVSARRVKKESVPASAVAALEFHLDKELQTAVRKTWGARSGTPSDVIRRKVSKLLPVIEKPGGDPKAGRQLFLKSCAKCHILFGEGDNVGPDLTSFQRNDLRGMLINVVDPSAEIREGYETFAVRTDRGKVVTGFLLDQDDKTITLRAADGSTSRFVRDDLDGLVKRKESLMPEGLLKALSETQVRDLFSYLRSAQPLNLK